MDPSQWRQMIEASDPVRLSAGDRSRATSTPKWILPGSFDPLHDGHRGMVDWVSRQRPEAVHYELSIENVDKPLLERQEVMRRVAQFTAGDAVWVTRAATFADKAQLFPAATFLVGVDTIVRIADSRYYGGGPTQMEHAWRRIAAVDCHFLVFGRLLEREFRTLDGIALPALLRQRCSWVAEQSFRVDISSTELRQTRSVNRDREP